MPRRSIGTGLSRVDAEGDFSRVRRERAIARLAGLLRGRPGDIDVILPFEEVIDALGRVSERHLGLRTIPLDAIVGTVDRARDFDRSFRPTSARPRPRWERIANALRRGESVPPISVFKVGDLYFVRDGHHRVSVARALDRGDIDAYVTEVETRLDVDTGLQVADLPLKGHERVFRERVPLPTEAYAEIVLPDPWRYAALAEGVEAWGFRRMQDVGHFMSREQVARAWWQEEYRPVVAMLREGGLIGAGTEAEAYMRVATERYRLLRTHVWSEEVLDRLRRELR